MNNIKKSMNRRPIKKSQVVKTDKTTSRSFTRQRKSKSLQNDNSNINTNPNNNKFEPVL